MTRFRGDCPFCRIVTGEAPAADVVEYHGATAFRPLEPVTPGHMLVVPNAHIAHAGEDPAIAARAFEAAAQYARDHFESFNLITAAGEAATQTVYHLHLHVVPRRFGDRLHLPWTKDVQHLDIPVRSRAPALTPTTSPAIAHPMEPAEWLASRFHAIYEELAPSFAYETRQASAVPWDDVPENNRALMIATAERVWRELFPIDPNREVDR